MRVRIVANRMASVPLMSVASAIGLNMPEPPSLRWLNVFARDDELCQGRVLTHHFREEAFVGGAQLGEAHRLLPAAADEVEGDRIAAGRSDRHGEELGSVRGCANGIRVLRCDNVAALVF